MSHSQQFTDDINRVTTPIPGTANERHVNDAELLARVIVDTLHRLCAAVDALEHKP